MAGDLPNQVTQLLLDSGGGKPEALERLMPLVYSELRRIARHYLRRERPDHTLQSGGLVNEAYLRLIDQRKVRWQNRAHFFGIAARMMRRILVDHARKHQAAKRGGPPTSLAFDEAIDSPGQGDVNLLALDDALRSLAALHPRQSRIVELRFFGGLTVEETAEVVGISPATVTREWTTAKTWLSHELKRA